MERPLNQAGFAGTGPQGHRGRMRSRLLAGPGALADYEILEMLLFLGIPRRDTKPQAKGLINRFGSLSEALAAGRAALGLAGVPRRAIEAMELVRDAAEQLAQAERRDRVLLNDWAALGRFLETRTARSPGLVALLLNGRNQLLDECACEGDGEAVARAVLRRALERHATAVILVRHGAGPPVVTAGDAALCEEVRAAGAALSVLVHDLVVTGAGTEAGGLAWVALDGAG